MDRFKSAANRADMFEARRDRKSGLDASLDKLTYTLRDFTSHLSHVDSALDRMEGGFQNVSQFCRQLSQSASPLIRGSGDEVAPDQTTLSDSSCSGRSFECSYQSDAVLPRHADGRVSPSSSMTGTVSNQSSVWSSSSHSEEKNEYQTTNLDNSEANGSAKASFLPTGLRTQYNPSHSPKNSTNLSPSHSSNSSAVSHSQPSLNSPRFECSNEIPRYINHKVTSGQYRTRQPKPSVSQLNVPENEHKIAGRFQPPSLSSHGSTIERQAAEHAFYGHKHSPRGIKLPRHDSKSKSSESSIARDSSSISPLPTHQFRSGQLTRSLNQLPSESEQLVTTLEDLLRLGEESKARRILSHLLDSPGRRTEVNSIFAALSNRVTPVHEAGTCGDNRESLIQLATSAMDLRGQYSSRQLTPVLVDPQMPGKPCGSACSLSANHSSKLSLFPHNRSPSHDSQSGYRLTGAPSVLPALTVIPWHSETMALDARLPVVRQHPPAAPQCNKSIILPMPEVIQRLDAEAMQATDLSVLTSFTEVVARLTATLSDEVRVFRSLFVWTVGVRLEDYQLDQVAPPESFVGLLRRVQAGQVARNELLRRLCRYAGIDCRLVTGYSKQASDYRPKSSCGLLHTSWLAVHVSNGWRLANVDFASRLPGQMHQLRTARLVESRDAGCTEFRCNEFHFLTDPEEHIYECFPDQKAWQLLRKPISFQAFLSLPLLKSAFFNAGLALKDKYSASLLTSNGQVVVKLCMPRFVGISCSLENALDHSVLRGLCLVEVMPSGDLVRVEAAPSQPGKYYLHIFVSPDWRVEDQRELACSFQINCSEHNYSRLVVTGRLPEVGFLGPTPIAKTLGIGMLSEGVARAGRPFISQSPGSQSLRIPFGVAAGLKVCHQLKSFDRPGHQMVDCDSYALLQMQSRKTLSSRWTGNHAYYQIRMPADGFYYLTVYATHLSDSDHLECVYRLLVSARKSSQTRQGLPAPFPRQTLWWVHCRLVEPTSQRLAVGREYRFELEAPLCDAVAVVVNEADWHFLTTDGGAGSRWLGRVHTGSVLGSLSVFGRFPSSTQCLASAALTPDDDVSGGGGGGGSLARSVSNDEAFVKLLDYLLVEPGLATE